MGDESATIVLYAIQKHELQNAEPGTSDVSQPRVHLDSPALLASADLYLAVTRYAPTQHPGSAPLRELARTDRHLCDFPELAREV